MTTVGDVIGVAQDEVLSSKLTQLDLPITPQHPLTADKNSLCFLKEGLGQSEWGLRSPSLPPIGLAIVAENQAVTTQTASNWIAVRNPRYVFAKICSILFPYRNGQPIDDGAIHRDIEVMDSGVLATARITFDRAFSGGGVVIFPGVSIGSGTFIRSGTVLGSDGFGYEPSPHGEAPVRLQHYGGLQIGRNCDIGSSVSIDRGTFDDTTIGDGVKMDNLVHIAHNVIVGDNTMIAAGAAISGSVKIGSSVWIGPNVTVSNGLEVGDAAHLGLGSVILRDVLSGQKVFGNPARQV